jgi:alcohol dehydrogenase class IV
MIRHFSLARFPRIEFGPGAVGKVPQLAARYGSRALLVTGAQSFQASPHWEPLQSELGKAGLDWLHTTIDTEPSPQMVDSAVKGYAGERIDVVIAIGGGSVLDAAKAIAGLLRIGDPVMDYLEGVGPEKPYRGPAVPFIAVPTTAGTGSEATRNAVLSVIGEDGFKKSFRDEQLVPAWAVVDPDLLASCPREQIAANGMDALTQLIESYVSLNASRFTDSMAIDGIRAARDALLPLYDDPAGAAAARAGMAYAALLSGITLAQTGLGSVHGLASPLGAFFPIPHGMVCGTLVATCSRVNIEAMLERDAGNVALEKYTEVAEVLCRQAFSNRHAAHTALVGLLEDWTRHLQIRRLAHYGIGKTDFDRIVANCRGSSMKTNPVVLTDTEIAGILGERL